MITGIQRLFGYGINCALIKNILLPPAVIAGLDDGGIGLIIADAVVNELDDFNAFRFDFQFVIAQIFDPECPGSGAQHPAVFFISERIDAVLAFLLQIFIQDLIFDQRNQLLVKLHQVDGSALNL